MIPVLASTAWEGEMTIRYRNDAELIDYRDVERIAFEQGPKGLRIRRSLKETLIGSERVPAPPGVVPEEVFVPPTLEFTPSADALEARVMRVWATLLQPAPKERAFPAQGDLPAAKVLTWKSPGAGEKLAWRYADQETRDPVQADGTATISTRTGALVEFDGNVPRIRIPGGDAWVAVTLSFR